MPISNGRFAEFPHFEHARSLHRIPWYDVGHDFRRIDEGLGRHLECAVTVMTLPSGNLLRAGRALAGLKASELAKLAGLDPSTISRLENAGSRSVRGQAQTVDAVVQALAHKGIEISADGVRLIKGRRK